MIALDTNILVYAHRAEMPFHSNAREALRGLAENTASHWALPWTVVHEFLAVVTNHRIFKHPTPVEEALRFLEILGRSPTLHFIGESADYWPTLRSTLMSSEVTGARVHDARIAAICLVHGIRELWSADRDHSRFHQLKTVNPLR